MALVTKVVSLDDTGKGDITVAPMFYVGSKGAAGVTNDGDALGTALLTPSTARFVVGDIHVYGGAADGECSLYFIQD